MNPRRIFLAIAVLTLLGPIFLDQFTSSQALTSVGSKVGMIGFQLGAVGILVALLPGRVLGLAMALFLLPSFVEWTHLARMGSYTTLGFWGSLLATNSSEIREMVSGFWLQMVVALGLAAACLVFVRRPIAFPWRTRRRVLSVALVPLVLVAARDARVLSRLDTPLREIPVGVAGLALSHLQRSHPVGIPLRILDAWSRGNAQREAMSKLSGFRYGVRPTAPPDTTRHVVVVVLGESSRASSWTVAGGDSGTTPRLSRRSDIAVFGDALAPANVTALSLPLLLTRASPEHIDSADLETGIVGLFREAGYQTWWITNQPLGNGGFGLLLLWTRMADTLSKCAAGDAMQGEPDDVVLPHVARALASPSRDLFLVVHLMGSHWRYSERYGPGDEHFRPAYRGVSYPGDAETLSVRNGYRNSIRVTDRVVDSILGLVGRSGREGVVAYVSDHGENLMDDDRKAILHVRPEPTLQEVRVPMVWWGTPEAVRRDSTRWRNARSRLREPVEAGGLLASLCLLSKLAVPGLDTAPSPFAGNWQRRERKVLSASDRVYSEKELR